MEFVTQLCAQLLELFEIVHKPHVNVNSIVVSNQNSLYCQYISM